MGKNKRLVRKNLASPVLEGVLGRRVKKEIKLHKYHKLYLMITPFC